MTAPAEEFARKLRYFAERARKGEKLDDCDADLMTAAASELESQHHVIVATQDRMTAAASILGRAR